MCDMCLFMCIHVFVCVHVGVFMWWSEDNLWCWVFPFYLVSDSVSYCLLVKKLLGNLLSPSTDPQ